ncbi:MAG: glycosyltransferase family 1 protein [Rhizobiaceae bacterium]|nr:glycosyltransferase family 1 protein [Rhizobiaceae bacterium]
MKRILHFTPGFRLGGVETLLLGLYRNLDRDRFQFDFVTDNLDTMEEFEEIRSMGGRVYQFGRYLDNPLAYQRKFVNVIASMDPDSTIFHSHDVLRSAPLLFACRRKGIKRRVLHSHTDSFKGSRREYFAPTILFLTNGLATHYFACSNEAGRFMFPGRDFSIFNNAVDLTRFIFDRPARDALRAKLGISPGAAVIGHTGRFTFQKNHDWIIRVFAEFVKNHSDSHLLLVGAGPLENEMRHLASKLAVSDRVIFAGRQNDVTAYLSAMDLFCLPSHFEGLPLSLIEAQANGLPILVSDIVTEEVCLTDAINKFSLKSTASEWASVLVGLHRKGRHNSTIQVNKLRTDGYDIRTQWKKLVSLYGLAP